MPRKALILTGKFVQDHEFTYPFYRLQEEGYEVDVVVKGDAEVVGAIGVRVQPTKKFSEVRVQDYILLVVPGGAKCMEYIRQDQDFLKFIADFHASGKVVASICHGTQMLISANLVKGRKMSGYYSIKDDINNAGGKYVDAPFVNDGRIVTSPHYKHLGPWMKEVIAEVNRPL